MKAFNLNWPIVVGLLLCLFAFFSYPLIFVQFPLTRDFPWANLLIFLPAAFLVSVGLRRAFAPGRGKLPKLIASVLATISAGALILFLLTFFVVSRWLPASANAPKVGQKAPEFTLTDTNNKPVSLAELLSTPLNGKPPSAVLLVFYRGYW